MTEDAKKLINLSLCKMAASRTIRRGGTSLHKHLLISKVLTKARTAVFFETLYNGDQGPSCPPFFNGDEQQHQRHDGDGVDVNSSYEEEQDFPLEDGDTESISSSSFHCDPSSSSDSGEDEVDSSSPATSSHRLHNHGHVGYATSTNLRNNFPHAAFARPSSPPSYYRHVEDDEEEDNESEIELPSDILSCVEKMGDISDMSFNEDEASACTNPTGASSSPSSQEQGDGEDTLAPSPFDSSFVGDLPEGQDPEQQDSEGAFGSPNLTSTPLPSKRRRSWAKEEDYEEECFPNENVDLTPHVQKHRGNSGKARGNNIAKRLRYTSDTEDSGVSLTSPSPSPATSPTVSTTTTTTTTPTPTPATYKIKDKTFRIKKSHFSEDEQEDSDDDPFLGDSHLSQSSLSLGGATERSSNSKSDQRVPSTSAGSSSDEDADENSMEVENITNLVQFISFKHQSNPKSPLQVISNSPISSTSGPVANHHHWPTVYS